MARPASLLVIAAMLVCSGFAHGTTISDTADYIQNRPYHQLSTENPIGNITSIQKASGIVPSVGHGLAVWADGRGGRVAIIGYDLTKFPLEGEFLISDENDGWQEGNPFAAFNAAIGSRWTVYDATNVSVNPGGDPGDIQGSPPTHLWLVQQLQLSRQRSPVSTNPNPEQTYLAWIDYPGTISPFPGYPNTDIYTAPVPAPIPSPLPGLTNITAGIPAPRDSLAADGRHLIWQELRYDDNEDVTSWDIVVYDLNNPGFNYINAPNPLLNQIDPDVSGELAVWTQEEDPSGTGATNIYFQDLASAVGPIAVTTTGAAAKAAISRSTVEENGQMIETCFVVWKDHHQDGSTSFYAGGNGETDYNWDIWGQELRVNGGTGEWDLHMDPFLIRSDVGRQTNPDIDGLDVVWQTQAPNVEDIYVWGPLIPEPCTALVVAVGIPFMLLRTRRKLERQGQ